MSTNPRVLYPVPRLGGRYSALVVLALALLCAPAPAAIVFSTPRQDGMAIAYAGGYLGSSDSCTFSIADHLFSMSRYGWADLPNDPGMSWVMSAASPETGLFTAAYDARFARNFADGDVIGPAQSGLKMFDGSMVNRVLQSGNLNSDPYDAGGEFGKWQVGHIGFAFGSPGQLHYGWIKVELDLGHDWRYDKYIGVIGWAYNDVANEAITVPAPGAPLLLVACCTSLVRRRR